MTPLPSAFRSIAWRSRVPNARSDSRLGRRSGLRVVRRVRRLYRDPRTTFTRRDGGSGANGSGGATHVRSPCSDRQRCSCRRRPPAQARIPTAQQQTAGASGDWPNICLGDVDHERGRADHRHAFRRELAGQGGLRGLGHLMVHRDCYSTSARPGGPIRRAPRMDAA